MKLNYRHSLTTMRESMLDFNETFSYVMEAGTPLFTVKEMNPETGKLTKTCGHFYCAGDMADYINKRNAV